MADAAASRTSEALEDLAKRVMEAARECRLTVAAAESCTAGAIASCLARVPGAGDQFHGSVVAYSKEMKHQLLGVSRDVLERKTAVCAEVAEAMARGLLQRAPADLAVAITGVAGPEPDEDGNPVGLIYCSVARKGGPVRSLRFHSRETKREAILADGMRAALELLLAACRERTA
jgi:nicotinamide-nucleotide amidase